jgi:CubicO group peptidase (beta-lactamase class C family)
LLPGKLPAGIFAAVGHLGQYVIVSPAQKVTLVRLGHSDNAERQAVRERLAEILRVLPKG